jgi:hypothetical protein
MLATISRLNTILLSGFLLAAVSAGDASAQEPRRPESAEPAERQAPAPKPADAESDKAPAAAAPQSDAVDREGAALRNENVFASKIDTETQKADNTRMGGSYTPLTREH